MISIKILGYFDGGEASKPYCSHVWEQGIWGIYCVRCGVYKR